MCGGVKFSHDGELLTVYFPNPKAVLPVRLRNGEHQLLVWGRRKEEPGNLPPGGWARHESIKSGKWDRFFPKPVLIDVSDFMEKDNKGNSHWYPVIGGLAIQGLVARDGNEVRVYVVTITPKRQDQYQIHNRWPRIVQKPDTGFSDI